MPLKSDELLREFSRTNPDVQDLSIDEIRDIVYAPWKYMKMEMESGDLPEIRLKFFGVFKVKKNRAKWLLSRAEKDLEKGTFTQERYEYIKEMLQNFLKT